MTRRARTVEGRNRIQNRDWQAGRESNAHSFGGGFTDKGCEGRGWSVGVVSIQDQACALRRGRHEAWPVPEMAASSPPRGEHADGDLSELLWSLQDM